MSEASERLKRDLAGGSSRFQTAIYADIRAVLDELERLANDGDRYRKLRARHWTDGGYVIAPLGNVQLGSDCLSGDRLDAMIDALPSGPLATDQPLTPGASAD